MADTTKKPSIMDGPTTAKPATTGAGNAAGIASQYQGAAGVIAPATQNVQPAQPNKYIGVQSPYWDQNPDGSWFWRPGYNRTINNPGASNVPTGLPGQVLTPKYFEGDEYGLISGLGLPPETVAAIQAKMAEAKLMPKNYNIGTWEAQSVAAFKEVLAYANQTTQDWTTALDDLAQSGASIPGPKGPVFTAHLTNPDDIKKVFKQASYNLLGGKFVDDSQADAFTQSFQAQELNSQRAAFNAATGGGGTVTDAPSASTAAETELTATDPEGVKAKRYNDYADVLASVLSQKAPQI